MALFLILPTRSAARYRGKRPTFPRSISAGITGLQVELNNGLRLWAAPGFGPAELPKLDSDFALIAESAPAMTADEYAALLAAGDLLRGRLSERRESGEALAELNQRARTMAAAIVNDSHLAERNARDRRAALLAGESPRGGFDPAKPFRVYNRGPWGNVCFDFATLPEAESYLTGQAERRAFMVTGAAPAGPHGDSIDPLASFIVWPEGVKTLAALGWNPPADKSRLWTRAPAPVDSGLIDPLGGLRGTGELAPAPVRTIDTTPTWAAMESTFRLLIENGNAEGRRTAWEEIAKALRLADERNAMAARLARIVAYRDEMPAGAELDGESARQIIAIAADET